MAYLVAATNRVMSSAVNAELTTKRSDRGVFKSIPYMIDYVNS